MRALLSNLLRTMICPGVALGTLVLASCAPLVVVSDWKQIGPGPILDPGTGLINAPGGTVSGLVTDIAIDPSGTADSVIYIATDAGYLEVGRWGQVLDPKNRLHACDYDGRRGTRSSNTSIVYAGSGSLFNFGDFNAAGVYKSTNGGTTGKSLIPAESLRPRRAVLASTVWC